MHIRTRAIVLNKTKYSDSSLIARIFTREAGVQSFILKGAFSKKNKGKLALLENLSLVELTFDDHHEGIKYLNDITLYHPYSLIPFDMVRRTLFIFYNEILYKTLTDYSTDAELFDFVENALLELDEESARLADIHLRFLVDFSRILGFSPKDNFSEQNCHFFIEESAFGHDYFDYPDYLSREASAYLADLMHGEATELPPKIVRNELLYGMIRYFERHNEQIHRIESVQILSALLTK